MIWKTAEVKMFLLFFVLLTCLFMVTRLYYFLLDADISPLVPKCRAVWHLAPMATMWELMHSLIHDKMSSVHLDRPQRSDFAAGVLRSEMHLFSISEETTKLSQATSVLLICPLSYCSEYMESCSI